MPAPLRVRPVRLLVLALVAALAGGGLWWWSREDRAASPDLVLFGNVEIRQVELGFRVGGRVLEMLAEEGRRTEAGELLAHLDPGPAEDALRRARAEVAMQEAELAKMRRGYRPEDVEQARAAEAGSLGVLKTATASLRRIEALYAGKAVSRRELDDARAAFAQAQARHTADAEQLRLMQSGFRPEDVARQEAALEAARAAQATAQTTLADTELRAPGAGVILTRVREPGAVVQPGQTVYAVSLVNPVWIRAYVPQPELGLVRPGQAAWLEVDAAPGKRFPGTVGFISPTAEFTPKTVETREVRNDLVFRFRVVADDPEQVMRQGMPVTVILRRDEKP